MIKNKTVLEVKIGERDYELNLSADSPLGEIFDALCKMQSFVIAKMSESQPKDEPKVESIEQ